jgi:FdhE protein
MNEQTVTQAVARLDRMRLTDPTVASLARLHAEALQAAADVRLRDAVTELDTHPLERGVPLLDGQTLRAHAGSVRRLLTRLTAVVGKDSGAATGAMGLNEAIKQGALDVASLLRAAIVHNDEALTQLARSMGVDTSLLATIASFTALPLLQVCGRRADPVVARIRWTSGFCPVCAAWPILAELRGLDRERWLRCGRCGSGWCVAHVGCPYCANTDQRSSGYLAPEQQRESRRAVTCDVCRGYIKTVTTFQAIPPVEIGLMDMQTLELDIAALEQDYGRPEVPGFPLEVAVELTERRSRWPSWSR